MKIFRLSQLLTIILILLVTQTCKKDDIITDPDPNLEEVHYENTTGIGEIGQAGGSITIVDPSSELNGVSVSIPSGALGKVEEIKISLAPGSVEFPGDETVDIINFEPAGLEFQKEIEISLPFNVSDTTNLAVIYFDSESSTITEMPKTNIDIENGTISANTDHFSYYLVWDKSVRLAVEMLNINGKIGAKVRIAGYGNTKMGLKWVGTTIEHYFAFDNKYPNAWHCLSDPLHNDVFSLFVVQLFEEKWLGSSYKGNIRIDMKRERPWVGSDFAVDVFKHGSSTPSFQSGYLLEEDISMDKKSLGSWFSGEPLVFNFNDFQPDPNKKYFVKVQWVMASEILAYGNLNHTPTYKFHNKDEKRKISEMTSYNPDVNNNFIDDRYELWTSGNNPPVAQFVANNTNITPGQSVSFTDQSTNAPDNWQWDFGDGDNSTQQNPEHIYNSVGTYTVSVTATNRFGTDNETKTNYITVAENNDIPTLSTNTISSITETTATSGGNISDNGGATVTARGVCWSTSQNPTTASSKTNNGTGIGSFTSSLTGLTANTTYYVRAYATNSEGTAYGSQQSFTTNTATGLPVLTTNAVSSITETTATCGGNITDDGGAEVTLKGIVWDTSPNPSTSDSHTDDGMGIGSFTSSLTGLTAGTTYYVRAYAYNSNGIAYGNELSFTTTGGNQTGTLTDYDGNTYQTVTIGNQTWMAENLKVTHYANGTVITLVTDNTDWANLGNNNTDKAFCYYYNSDANRDTYGALYTYAAATNGDNDGTTQGVCPTGWHLPSDAEWTELVNYISNDGHSATEGTALKATSGWSISGNGTDDYGFSALPGGRRGYYSGTFSNLGYYATFWSAPEDSDLNAWECYLDYDLSTVGQGFFAKSTGFSVRCLKD